MAKPGDLYNIIERELNSAPVVEEFILSGLANISAVAEAFQPLVNAKIKGHVSRAAIGMTLRRYKSRKLESVPLKKKFPRSIDIRVCSSLVEVSARADSRAVRALCNLQKSLERKEKEILLFGSGMYELSVTTDLRHKNAVLRAFRQSEITSILPDIGCITVDWPPITKDIPGMYYRVTRALSRRDISVQSFHSIGLEMMIIVRSDVLSKAYTTICNLLSNSEFE